MALTPSTMLSLGTELPDFLLSEPGEGGATVGSKELRERRKPVLVMFICNHCPYVKHVAPELARIGKEYGGEGGNSGGVSVVAIQSNDIEAYPQDGPEAMAAEKAERGYVFPYLLDENQTVAKAFTAACTPDFFLFDREAKLVYRGQLDETRPHRISSGNYDDRDGSAHGKDLRAALDAVLAGRAVEANQVPSMGCNIKWKGGE